MQDVVPFGIKIRKVCRSEAGEFCFENYGTTAAAMAEREGSEGGQCERWIGSVGQGLLGRSFVTKPEVSGTTKESALWAAETISET